MHSNQFHWLIKFSFLKKKTSGSGYPLASLIMIVVLSVSVLFASRMSSRKFSIAAYIDQLMTLPEDQIDIGLVSLNLSKEFYPDLNIEAYSKKIDQLAQKVNVETRGSNQPPHRIWALNEVLFRQEGYGYDKETIQFGGFGPDHLNYLNHILDTKQGNCLSLTTLYLAVAQRLDYPIYPVLAPMHSFLRYVDPITEKSYNIEVTTGGIINPDPYYVKTFGISDKAIKAGTYLRIMKNREFSGILLTQNWLTHSHKARFDNNFSYLEKSIALAPLNPNAYRLLHDSHIYLSAADEGGQSFNYHDLVDQYTKTVDELGYVAMENTPYVKEGWTK